MSSKPVRGWYDIPPRMGKKNPTAWWIFYKTKTSSCRQT